MTAAELAKVLPERVRSAQIARMVVTMGGDGALYVDKDGSTGSIRQESGCCRHDRRRRCFLLRCLHRSDLRKEPAGFLQDRNKTCSDRDLYFGEYLPEIYAGRIWSCAVG